MIMTSKAKLNADVHDKPRIVHVLLPSISLERCSIHKLCALSQVSAKSKLQERKRSKKDEEDKSTKRRKGKGQNQGVATFFVFMIQHVHQRVHS